MNYNIPDELGFEVQDNKIKFSACGVSTNWMSEDDTFIQRMDKDALNRELLCPHMVKEIEIKNTLDEAVSLFESQKYPEALKKLDKILFYDSEYGSALLYKSYVFRAQKHFVKAFRYYKKAVKTENSLKDLQYHKTLLNEANNERDSFSKLKLNIYAGDESFSSGHFDNAISSYDKALMNPSRFKQKILPKLLNKKATAYLKLNDFENALVCFKQSLDVEKNDYAIFGQGLCEYSLGLEVSEEFRGCLHISKNQMLKQTMILNDLGCFNQSLKISDYLFKNHFKEDEFLRKLKYIRNHAENGLGKEV